MTIFKYILTKLTIYFRQKTGTVEENQKTELKTSQKGLRVVLQDFLGDLEKKKVFISMTYDLLQYIE